MESVSVVSSRAVGPNRPCSCSLPQSGVTGGATSQFRIGRLQPLAADFPRCLSFPTVSARISKARPIAQRATAAVPQSPSADLTLWMSEAIGAKPLKAEAVVAADRLALVATTSISQGEEVLSVPKAGWITPSTATSKFGQVLKGVEPWIQVALFLIAELGDPASTWRPYMESLPQQPRSPAFWDDNELKGLEGTQLLASCLGYREYFKQRYAQLEESLFKKHPTVFDAEKFTLDAFCWAAGTVRAQVHSPLEGDSVALVPFADLVSHSRDPNTVWELSSGGVLSRGESLTLVAQQQVRAGEVLTIDYGPEQLDNQIALNYGVVDKGLIKGGYVLTLTLSEDDEQFDDKIDILELAGLGQSATFNLVPGNDPSTELLGFLRLMNVSGPDSFHLEALFRNEAWDHMIQPLSDFNENLICETMVSGCRTALDQYKTNISSDMALLGRKGVTEKEAVAAQVRVGEQEGLRTTLKWFETRKVDLDSLEYYAERRLRRLGLLDEEGKSTYEGMMEDGIA